MTQPTAAPTATAISKPLHIPALGHICGKTLLAAGRPQCHYFGPLPYALPPTGQYRWRKPRALPKGYSYGTKERPGVYDRPARQCPQPVGPEGRVPGQPGRRGWDEDCLRVKVWVPAGEAPREGWPVLFFIHGGYLQFGSPNMIYPATLLAETPCQCIIVCPGYRLNLFGFLASEELLSESGDGSVGNYGFWDQRTALEWTWTHIRAFGGNPDNMTLGGYSAGAYSTFYQLSHDLFNPSPLNKNRPLVKRAIMHSNGPGLPPRPLTTLQSQFTSLLTNLSIPPTLPALEKLSRLRSLDPATLLQASTSIPLHEFRALADAHFVPPYLFSHQINDGAFARKLQQYGVQIMLGECRDENFAYGNWRSARVHDLRSMEERLCADYEGRAVRGLLREVYCRDGGVPKLPGKRGCRGWREAFGVIYADLQVHALERGFVRRLVGAGGEQERETGVEDWVLVDRVVPCEESAEDGWTLVGETEEETEEETKKESDHEDSRRSSSVGHLIHRYRIEHLLSCVHVPPGWGVTHGTDMAIWFWGNGMPGGLKPDEKAKMRRFLQPHWDFIKGADVADAWGTHARGSEDGRLMRTLTPRGDVEAWRDGEGDWERGSRVWEVVRRALEEGEDGGEGAKARL
ncbi:MAG: hypothetical protein M1831_003979 [Alyxoria varia]|nr:MAG: hypothetical protein M1831_003979 [Alyxoria varia]